MELFAKLVNGFQPSYFFSLRALSYLSGKTLNASTIKKLTNFYKEHQQRMPKNLSFHTFFKKFSKKKSEIVFVNTSNSFGVTDFIQHFFSGIISGHSLSVYNSQVFTIMAKLMLSKILTCNIKRDLNDCPMKRKIVLWASELPLKLRHC